MHEVVAKIAKVNNCGSAFDIRFETFGPFESSNSSIIKISTTRILTRLVVLTDREGGIGGLYFHFLTHSEENLDLRDSSSLSHTFNTVVVASRETKPKAIV